MQKKAFAKKTKRKKSKYTDRSRMVKSTKKNNEMIKKWGGTAQ